jgi:glucose/arabinose dehydrogenase
MRIAAFAGAFAALAAAAAPPALTVQPFVSGLAAPLELAHANDGSGRLYVLEQAGRVRLIRNGHLVRTPFLDITARVLSGGEEGLLGIAFHPSYAANGRFYVYYTRPRPGDAGGDEIVIERFLRSAANPDVADPASGSILLVIEHPQFGNHQSGKLAFGPDGYLYASVGDGGGGGDPFRTGQDLTQLRGKILRLDVDGAAPYAIPPTNPFLGSPDPAVRQEIWDYGLRNAWRYSFDRSTGDLLIADVGQDLWEEVDFEPAGSGGGRDYGWSVFEATHCFDPPTGCSLASHTPPVIEYHHDSAGGFSITGGYVYRGASLPSLAGYYVYGDFVSGHIWAALPRSWVPT